MPQRRSTAPLEQMKCTDKFVMEVLAVPFTSDELHGALAPEVCLFLDHGAWMLFFQRQLPSALSLHQKIV